ncbi:hypothetical protein AB2B41_18585 [Marimonas sp. MJW-29]|uniref:Arginine transporter n=1 Tax=Sulfitobacter sediminis TaxID=3234186 RepID=A0ABV3RRK5_9RHOB
MVRPGLVLVALLGLAACGGGTRYSLLNAGFGAPAVLYATGPIQKACLAQGRKAASRARCGCIQAVADMELSSSYQRRGASYFRNPAKLQEVRQSDAASNERFWTAWKAYGERAEQLCAAS